MATEIEAPVQVTEPDPSSQIYKATYSGVPVWEFRLALYSIVRSVAVMRRKTDSWLNATQILKVAEFDKPHRTRILEREVQKGEHEKVQGGYGKYQGTWVPYQTGVDLAERYHVKELLQPIIEFQPSSESPPLAPKHVTAASNKP
ncbi:20230_t:CDS:2, partial [Racocetra persica]